METKIARQLLKHKKEIIQGFEESFDLLMELQKHPQKLKRLPRKGILVKTKRGRMIISAKTNGTKTLLI